MDFLLLGPLCVHDGKSIRPITSRRQRSVLAALALRAGRVVPADRLIDEVWEAGPPARAADTIHSYVNRLRAGLGARAGARLRTVSPGYVLDLEPGEADVDRFRTLRRAGREAADRGELPKAQSCLAQALGQWRGEPLADLPDLAGRMAEVPVLQEQRTQTAEWLFDVQLELGRHAQVLPELIREAAEHPLRERFTAQLMTAYYRCGRRAEALDAYLGTHTRLAEQVGVGPGADLREVHRQILAGTLPPPARSVPRAELAPDRPPAEPPPTASSAAEPPPAEAAPHAPPPSTAVHPDPNRPTADHTNSEPARPRQLPAGPTDFFGRDAELARIQDALAATAERPAVVLVTGPGGVGKSTLAVRAARLAADRFPDGQLHLDLRGSSGQPRPVREVLLRILRDLGVEESAIPEDEEDRSCLYRTVLARRRVVILLDDAGEARTIRLLEPGEGGSALIVTSRLQLASLRGGTHLRLRPLSNLESRQLLHGIAGAGPCGADREGLDTVLRVCSGLPLALTIAAARLVEEPALSVRDLGRLLADHRERLDELETDDLSVRAVFDSSRNRLSAEQARVFDLLGLAAGPGAGEWDGEAVAALTGLGRARTERVLRTLLGVNLLESPRPGRYRFHDLISPFARQSAERLDPAAVRAAAGRLADWSLRRTVAADRLLAPERELAQRLPGLPVPGPRDGFADRAAALVWLEGNRDCLVLAVSLAHAAQLHRQAWRLAVAAWSFFFVRGYLEDLVSVGRCGEHSARAAAEPAGVAWTQNGTATALYSLGRLEEAEAELEAVLSSRRALGDELGVGVCLSNLGAVATKRMHHRVAVGWFMEALAVHERVGNILGTAMSLNNLGELYIAMGQPAQALEHLEAALRIRQETGNPRGEAMTREAIGKALVELGRPAEAALALTEARDGFRQTGDVVLEKNTQALMVRYFPPGGPESG